MNKKIKILTISLVSVSVVAIPSIVTPCLLASNNKQYVANTKYVFDGHTFDSKQDIINYASIAATSFAKKTKSAAEWSLNVNNKLVNFKNQKDLYKYLDQFIDQKAFTSFTNELKIDSSVNSLDLNDLSKMNFDPNITKTTIYRGKDNSIYTSELEAKKSYLQIHEVYYFNGIFFRSKEELAIWLEKNFQNYDNANSYKVYQIVLKDANSGVSLPINVEELKQQYLNNANNPNFIPNEIDNFVKTNNISYLVYHDNDTNKDIYVSEGESINNIINHYDPSFVKVISNQGKGNYIIDTSTEDEADLFGPYYVKSGTEILQITNKNNWRKIDGTDHAIVNEITQHQLISSFMNLILAVPNQNSESDVSKLPIYNIPDIQNEINTYFGILQKDLPKVYSSVRTLYDTMRQGKRYGEFLKTPILFLHTLDQLIYYNVGQKYIDLTRNFYTTLCEYFNSILYSTVPNAFLYSKNHKKFSFTELFGINYRSLDLNYDVESKIGEIIYEYPDLYEFINFLTHNEMYMSKLNSLEGIKFSKQYFKDSFNLDLNDKFKNEYELIWNILNAKTSNDLIQNLSILYEQNNDISFRPYYYISNFVSQQHTNDIAQIIIEYALDKENTIKKFNLTNEHINLLNKIALFNEENQLFYNPLGSYSIDNFLFLKKYYKEHNNNADPVLFSRMIVFMQFYGNVLNFGETHF